MNKELSFSTQAVHGRKESRVPATTTLVPPIEQSTSYVFDSVQDGAEKCMSVEHGHCYTRVSNPTNNLLEERLAELCGAPAGLSFGSGVGAISAVLLTVLQAGDHCVADSTLYSATNYLFATFLPRFGIEVDFADFSQLDVVEGLIQENTRLLYCETPANPTLKIVDLPALAELGKSRDILTVVDNTFSTPFVQKPNEQGIDVTIHSTTKYICGHGDALGGAVVGSEEFIEELRQVALKNLGSVAAPFNSWLMMRGMKTLAVRMERHCDNALKIAQWLEAQPEVERVYYPGLVSHPQHEVAKRTMDAYGAVIAFELTSGLEGGKAVMEAVELCTLAVSIGDVETLIQHPASMTHWYVSPEDRVKGGITDGMIRLSVGIEQAEDIAADLRKAFDKI